MATTWARDVDGGVEIDVWVVPGASTTAISGTHDGALRVRIAASPEKGRANRALERVVAKATGAAAAVVKGGTSRRKTVRIDGVDARHVVRSLLAEPPP